MQFHCEDSAIKQDSSASLLEPFENFLGLSVNLLNTIIESTEATFMAGSEKTGLLGFRPGLTQTCLYCHRGWLEA